ncbi:hypothetical protein I2W78_05870 [Streptomyces spinoverrucosus]|nr:hypothetical protein [Streptomyces spinoverrucosus]MBG0851388.1 hypothetical protein [Streptomyces spinoverrucosus]
MGLYSGYLSVGNDTPPPPGGAHQPPTDQRKFLRGSQITDQRGEIEFRTIFPGWYIGRAVHIHVKVHVGGELTPRGYAGGQVCHTGQVYFAEEAVLAGARVAPYNTNTVTRTTLDEDRFYGGRGSIDGLLDLSYRAGEGARVPGFLDVRPQELACDYWILGPLRTGSASTSAQRLGHA